jgi:hypothetical protein
MNQDNNWSFTKLPTVLKYQSISFLLYGELKFLERINKENKQVVQNFFDQKQYQKHVAALDRVLPDSYVIYNALENIELFSPEKAKNKAYVKFNSYLGLGVFVSIGLVAYSSMARRSWLQQLRSLYAEWDIVSMVNVTINNITQSCKDYVAPVVANLTDCLLDKESCDNPCNILNGKNETQDCRNLWNDLWNDMQTLNNCNLNYLYDCSVGLSVGAMLILGVWLTNRLYSKSSYLSARVGEMPIKIVDKLFEIYSDHWPDSEIKKDNFNRVSIKALRNSLESLFSNSSQQKQNRSLVEETIVDIGPGSLQQPLLG